MSNPKGIADWMTTAIHANPAEQFFDRLGEKSEEIDQIHTGLWAIECKMSNASDFDKLRLLLKSFGIGFDYFNDIDNGLILRCSSGGRKINGVGGSFTQFDFDEDGKFVEMGAW